MTEQLTSPSNCSIDSNLLRLNSSSSHCLVSPSQSNFGSHLKNNLVQFQQYKCQVLPTQIENISKKLLNQPVQGVGIGKKKLTILIDEAYDCNQDCNEGERFENIERVEKPVKFQKNKLQLSHGFDESSAYGEGSHDIDALEVISPIENKNLLKCYQLQQNLNEVQKQLDNMNNKLAEKDQKINILKQQLQQKQSQLSTKIEQSQTLSKQLTSLKNTIKQKDELITILQNQIHEKAAKNIQISYMNMNQIQQKMKQKDTKIKQLLKVNQKLKSLNKDLKRQLEISQKKVRDLEKQFQSKLCSVAQENIHRLKQSSLKIRQKQNIQRYNCSHHTKTQRDSINTHHNLNTTKDKQKQANFTATASGNGRKSLDRKKNHPNSNTISAGQLSQPKKPGSAKMAISSNSNPILNKKLMHK